MNKMINSGSIHNGAIAMIDILGFGEKNHRKSIIEVKKNVIDKIIELIEFANGIINRDRQRFDKFSNKFTSNLIKYIFFSDTLLLYIDVNESSLINKPEHALHSLCYACSLLVAKGFESNIPLRGAISYGEFFIQKDPVIIIGKVFHEISQLEKAQNWAGIVVSNNVTNYQNPYVIRYKVPFKKKHQDCLKTDAIENMNVINWLTHLINQPNFIKCFDSDEPDVIEKRINTEMFYKYMMKNDPGSR